MFDYECQTEGVRFIFGCEYVKLMACVLCLAVSVKLRVCVLCLAISAKLQVFHFIFGC